MNRRRIGSAAVIFPLLLVGLVSMGSAWAQAAMVLGEVMKIDKAAGRVTLKHGDIAALDMPPMTMVWRVSEASLLDGLAVGDRVRFAPAKVNGQYTVTGLIRAPQ